jgi:hypothetical protein
MKLGFGFEEQAGLIADVMASMRRSGVLGTATNAQIAEATEKYATNLRIIADITGQDAKQALAQAEKKNQQYAVDAKLRKVAQETGQKDIKAQFDAFIATIEAVAPDQADAYRQMFVTSNRGIAGVTTNLTANMTGYTQTMDKTIQQMYTGAFSAGKALESQSGFAQKFSNNIDEIGEAVGIAGQMIGGQSAEYARGYTELQSLMIKLQDPKAAIAAAEERKKVEDSATTDLINAEKNAQELRIKQEAIFTRQLGEFSKVVATILENLEKTVEKYMGQFKEKSITDALMHIGTSMLEGVGTGATAAAAYSWMGGPSAPAVATGLTIGGTVLGAGKGIYDVYKGEYADGGIASGPTSGYSATLHGTEAVVPLPDNRSIPVTISGESADSKKLTTRIDGQTSLINHLLLTGSSLTDGLITRVNELTQGVHGLLSKKEKPNTDITAGIVAGYLDTVRSAIAKIPNPEKPENRENTKENKLNERDTATALAINKQSEVITQLLVTGRTMTDGLIAGALEIAQKIQDLYRGENANNKIVSNLNAELAQKIQTLYNEENATNTKMVSEPLSGYQSALHSADTTVQAANDKPIPVTMSDTDNTKMNTKELTSAIDRQSGLIGQLLVAMERNNQLTSGILQTSY